MSAPTHALPSANQGPQSTVQPEEENQWVDEAGPPTAFQPPPPPPTQMAQQPARQVALKTFGQHLDIRIVPVKIHLPKLLPGYAPLEFDFKLALSDPAQKQREEWLALPFPERQAQNKGQALNEVCDLLVADPRGFNAENYPSGPGLSPGDKFRQFYNSVTDSYTKAILDHIVEAADTSYWNYVLPREFPA